jgi:3-hydroxybutyryl-CoA dehydrogenase
MRYAILKQGDSRSFPEGDAFLANATHESGAGALLCLGTEPPHDSSHVAVLVELGSECLADHVGLDGVPPCVLGFARYRNGADAPSNLVEIVRHGATGEAAFQAAREVFEGAGFTVAVCGDQAGRIIDRLVRPKYNAALRLLDEGLATQADMDLTCRLGLGYSDGPIERVLRGGLAEHHAITASLFEVYGTAGYAPARQAVVAARRARRG